MSPFEYVTGVPRDRSVVALGWDDEEGSLFVEGPEEPPGVEVSFEGDPFEVG